MADGFVQVPPDSTGAKVDCASLSVGGVFVVRQRVEIASSTVNFNISAMPAVTIAGTATVAGSFVLSGTAVVSGSVNISTMPSVVIAAGVDNIGSINNISRTVLVAGVVTLGGQSAGYNVFVQGGVFAGTSITSGLAPVVIGGYDGTNARFIKTDANGNLIVNNVSATVLAQITSSINLNISAMPAITGTVNLSGTPSVVLAAGTANFGTLNNISATVLAAVTGTVNISGSVLAAVTGTVNISGAVALAAGAANIGTINNISAAVVLGAGAANIGTLNGISQTISVIIAAGTANIGTIQAISAPVALAAGTTVNISNTPSVVLAAGTANFGTLNGISATINAKITIGTGGAFAGTVPIIYVARDGTWGAVASGGDVLPAGDRLGRTITINNAPAQPPSASHGPKTVTLSASANTVLCASQGAACVYVTGVRISTQLAAVTRCDLYTTTNSAAPEVSTYLPVNGSFQMDFNPPWKISAGQALSGRLKPSASAQVLVTVHFHTNTA